MKNKILFLLILLFLFSCYNYKESNELAIPPIAKDELTEILNKKKKTSVKNEKLNKNETNIGNNS